MQLADYHVTLALNFLEDFNEHKLTHFLHRELKTTARGQT
jgi:hypothetical protein